MDFWATLTKVQLFHWIFDLLSNTFENCWPINLLLILTSRGWFPFHFLEIPTVIPEFLKRNVSIFGTYYLCQKFNFSILPPLNFWSFIQHLQTFFKEILLLILTYRTCFRFHFLENSYGFSRISETKCVNFCNLKTWLRNRIFEKFWSGNINA